MANGLQPKNANAGMVLAQVWGIEQFARRVLKMEPASLGLVEGEIK